MREEEEALRQQMLAKLAEDDRIEQLNAQKRRMKQLEHKMAVQKILEERRKQCIAEKVRVPRAPLVSAVFNVGILVLSQGMMLVLLGKGDGNCREQ